jgi:hypothetical protein
VAGRAGPQQSSRPHKSQAKGSDHTELAASSEVATRRKYLGIMSGPLCGMPDGTTLSAQVAINSAAPADKQLNKPPIDASGFTDKRGFLSWVRAPGQSGLLVQIKGEKLMLVPRTADGFKATVSALRTLMGARCVFTPLPRRFVVCFCWLKNLSRQLLPDDVRGGEMENLGISVQGVLQHRSGRRHQEASKSRPLTPYLIMPLAWGPKVAKLRSLAELCSLRVSVEACIAPKGPLQC